uniref:Ig-like domain-containing protein n=1 Tax=Gopherus evgoodei TaxID=1825980 RepID=A0A8C4YEL4_9SAUR
GEDLSALPKGFSCLPGRTHSMQHVQEECLEAFNICLDDLRALFPFVLIPYMAVKNLSPGGLLKYALSLSLEGGWGSTENIQSKSYSSLTPLPFHLGIRKKEPSVTISRAYHEDISGNRVSLTLICEASGFYPEEISISWLKNNSPELKSSYNNGPVSGSGIFSAYSILKVDKSVGAVNYTCVVHHPAMEEPKKVVEKVSLGKWILRAQERNPSAPLPHCGAWASM